MDKQVISVAAAARKILPDCIYNCQFEAMLPIFRVRLVGQIQVGTAMSSAARFVLRCISLEVDTLSGISQLLGLDPKDVGCGAAELRGLGLVESHACDSPDDTRFTVSQEGRRVLDEEKKLFKLLKRSLELDFNPLTGGYQSCEEDTLSVDDARLRGDFIEPVGKKRRPRPGDIKLEDVRDAVKADGQLPDDADLVGIVKMDQPFVRYRPVIVTVVRQRESNEQRVLVFKGRRHLDKESQELQRLLEAGKEVIQPGLIERQETASALPGASEDEKQNIDRILRLEEEAVDLESVIEGSKESAESSTVAAEKANLDMQAKLDAAMKEIEELKKRHAAETSGKARYVSGREHRPVLLQALREAKSDVLIVVPWLLLGAVDDNLCAEVSKTLARGVRITIVWGLGTKWGHNREQAKAKSKPAIDRLKAVKAKIPGSKLNFVERETHEKLLFCDSKFVLIGSYNWLSAAANLHHKESSRYSERPEDIELLRKQCQDLIGKPG